MAALGAAACGVPKSQYDAAVTEQKKTKDQLDADEKQIAELKSRIADLEGRQAGDEQTRKELEELRSQKAAIEARAKLFDDFVKKFKTMIDAGKLDITTRRGQIVLALATDVLFDMGKTELKPEGKDAIGKVAKVLATMPADRHFLVAGHTDNLPIKTKKFQSNWELSTQRAVEVLRLLIDGGMKPSQVGAAGYAEYDPAADNSTAEGQKQNRRIEIVVEPNLSELPSLEGLTGK